MVDRIEEDSGREETIGAFKSQIEQMADVRPGEVLQRQQELERRVTGLESRQQLIHPPAPKNEAGEPLQGEEALQALRQNYGQIVLGELVTAALEAPREYERITKLHDFLDSAPRNPETISIPGVGPERLLELTEDLKGYIRTRRTVEARIRYHLENRVNLEGICDPKQTSIESVGEMRAFENDDLRPEVKKALHLFLNMGESKVVVIDGRPIISTEYARAKTTAGSTENLYRTIDKEITKWMMEGGIIKKPQNIPEEDYVHPRASRAREAVEGYLRVLGWTSSMDPAFRTGPDAVRDSMNGFSRSLSRQEIGKPATMMGRLFISKALCPDGASEEEKKQAVAAAQLKYTIQGGNLVKEFKARVKMAEAVVIPPVIMLQGERNIVLPEVMTNFYDQMVIKGKISDDGRQLILEQETTRMDENSGEVIVKKEEYLPPGGRLKLGGIGIRGKTLAVKQGEDYLTEESLRGQTISLSALDLMTNVETGEVTPLPEWAWDLLPKDAFGMFLFGWKGAGMLGDKEKAGFLGLTFLPADKWEAEDIYDYNRQQALNAAVMDFMAASPILNRLVPGSELVKIDANTGNLFFGREALKRAENEQARLLDYNQVRERMLANLLLLGIISKSPRMRLPYLPTSKRMSSFGPLAAGVEGDKRQLVEKDITFIGVLLKHPPAGQKRLIEDDKIVDDFVSRAKKFPWLSG